MNWLDSESKGQRSRSQGHVVR